MGTDQGVVAVTYEPSIEYVFDPDASAQELRSVGLTGSQINSLRRDPFNVSTHINYMENTANKSQAFLVATST